jgi:hypothetical protein
MLTYLILKTAKLKRACIFRFNLREGQLGPADVEMVRPRAAEEGAGRWIDFLAIARETASVLRQRFGSKSSAERLYWRRRWQKIGNAGYECGPVSHGKCQVG